ncbi:hypothetical protein ASC97_15445 [Rhizobium sp. Root1203]|nr:hypothetical protein ASC97_15445 [Rhizobium sp. Root1203]
MDQKHPVIMVPKGFNEALEAVLPLILQDEREKTEARIKKVVADINISLRQAAEMFDEQDAAISELRAELAAAKPKTKKAGQ